MLQRLTLAMLAATLVSTISGLTASPEAVRAETTRRVFFSAADAKGAAVTDLTASDLTVKEGGRERAVAALAPATGPFQVAILVDDGGGGYFQGAVAHFIIRTLGRAEYAISLLNPQPLKLVDYTADPAALQPAVARLRERGRIQADPLQLIEAVSWAAKELRDRKVPRPVILVITSGGEPGYSEAGDFILNDLKASGASLHVVHANGVDLGKVLGDGPKHSGGSLSNAATSQDVNDALSRIAASLQSQYELTYVLPDGVRPSDGLELRTTRPGVTLIAPQRIPAS
jgi:hypothetical protein